MLFGFWLQGPPRVGRVRAKEAGEVLSVDRGRCAITVEMSNEPRLRAMPLCTGCESMQTANRITMTYRTRCSKT